MIKFRNRSSYFFLKNLYLIVFVFAQNSFSQELQSKINQISRISVYSKSSNLPIEGASAKLTFINDSSEFVISDKQGVFKISPFKDRNNEIKSIEISSLGYKKIVTKFLLQSYFLNDNVEDLNEIVIPKKSNAKQELSFFEKLNSVPINFSWEGKAAVFIPKVNGDSQIKKVLFGVSDFGGVKNLKYLPFKFNLYTKDSLGYPDKPLLEKDILIAKKDSKIWTKVDVSSYNLKMPNDGVFIVFILLKQEEYKYKNDEFISSKIGAIAAVPALRAYRYQKDYIRKSYYFHNYFYLPLQKSNIWTLEECHYWMDIEF